MLNCNEIYDRGGKSTNIFKEHLILRKGMKIDSIIENLKEKLKIKCSLKILVDFPPLS